MRYQVTATVSGNLYIDKPFSKERDGILFEFLVDEKSCLTAISVSLQVSPAKIRDFTNSLNWIKASIPVIEININKELHDRLISELQALEVSLAFPSMGALNGIDWQNIKYKYLPESPDEDKFLLFEEFSIERVYQRPSIRLSTMDLEDIVNSLPEYAYLSVPKAFLKEGYNYYSISQYVMSYYHFYFVIEEFYAKGKTGMQSVLSEFAKSKEYEEIAGVVLKETLQIDEHRVSLLGFFSEESCNETPQGLQKLLFHIRGNLHHYYSKSPKTRGTPFNQEEYRTPALVAMQIAHISIMRKETALRDSKTNI